VLNKGKLKPDVRQHGAIRRIKFERNVNIFRCPICEMRMNIRDSKDMICAKGHCFNLAKKGYINLLSRPIKTEYNTAMFRSRNRICVGGFFDPILDYISDWILRKIDTYNLKNIKVLDAGCGEGSLLGQVVRDVERRSAVDLSGVGIDISKEGILVAAKGYFDIIWCVADLANLPFLNGQFDVILNILSPANYAEFARTLKGEGVLIKVIPGSNYLKELREILYDGTDKETYSNERVVELYSKNFKILHSEDIMYSKTLSKQDLIHFVEMTPLSWAAADERIKQALVEMNDITVDFTVIIGKTK